MTEPDPLILEQVTAGYPGRVAIREVSLRVSAGEVVGLIGPNGSGKTTVIRVGSRALRPRRGRVLLRGRDLGSMRAREAARWVAVVPQELPATFDFTVLELVLMGRSPYLGPLGGGGPEDYGRAREAMEEAGVHALADRPLGELSGGEKQRAVLAQALVQGAPMLLLDEPTTHLDLRHVRGILGTVRRLASEGCAVLAVFHDLTTAAGSCDRLVALDGGRVVAEGVPEEVITVGFLRRVYGVEAEVHPHVATGRPTVVLGSPPDAAPRRGLPRAHVVGGAGRGAPLMRALAEAGYEVTAGVLHVSDTDEAVAERLNLDRVTVPPFSEVDERAAGEVLGLMRRAAVVVVSDAPYGPGNVANLRAALRAAEEGIRVVLLDAVPIRERDFTDGEATTLWARLRERSRVAASYDDVVASAAGAASS